MRKVENGWVRAMNGDGDSRTFDIVDSDADMLFKKVPLSHIYDVAGLKPPNELTVKDRCQAQVVDRLAMMKEDRKTPKNGWESLYSSQNAAPKREAVETTSEDAPTVEPAAVARRWLTVPMAEGAATTQESTMSVVAYVATVLNEEDGLCTFKNCLWAPDARLVCAENINGHVGFVHFSVAAEGMEEIATHSLDSMKELKGTHAVEAMASSPDRTEFVVAMNEFHASIMGAFVGGKICVRKADGSAVMAGGRSALLQQLHMHEESHIRHSYMAGQIKGIVWPTADRIVTVGDDGMLFQIKYDKTEAMVRGGAFLTVQAVIDLKSPSIIDASPDGTKACTASIRGTRIALYSLETSPPEMLSQSTVDDAPAEEARMFSLSIKYSPDGTRLALARRPDIMLINADDLTVLSFISPHGLNCHSLSWHTSGALLAAGGTDDALPLIK